MESLVGWADQYRAFFAGAGFDALSEHNLDEGEVLRVTSSSDSFEVVQEGEIGERGEKTYEIGFTIRKGVKERHMIAREFMDEDEEEEIRYVQECSYSEVPEPNPFYPKLLLDFEGEKIYEWLTENTENFLADPSDPYV